jgi:mono/diheme cytochrome c family protein
MQSEDARRKRTPARRKAGRGERSAGTLSLSIGEVPAPYKRRYALNVRSRATVFLTFVVAAASLLSADVAVAANPGSPARGKALFLRAGLFCGSCHALKAARSTGRSGPNLDRLKPSYARIVAAVTRGLGPTKRWPTGMPRFGGAHGELDKGRIADIAAFVYTATHR